MQEYRTLSATNIFILDTINNTPIRFLIHTPHTLTQSLFLMFLSVANSTSFVNTKLNVHPAFYLFSWGRCLAMIGLGCVSRSQRTSARPIFLSCQTSYPTLSISREKFYQIEYLAFPCLPISCRPVSWRLYRPLPLENLIVISNVST